MNTGGVKQISWVLLDLEQLKKENTLPAASRVFYFTHYLDLCLG